MRRYKPAQVFAAQPSVTRYEHLVDLVQYIWFIKNGSDHRVSKPQIAGEGRAARRADRRLNARLGEGKMRAMLRHARRATRPNG